MIHVSTRLASDASVLIKFSKYIESKYISPRCLWQLTEINGKTVHYLLKPQ